MDEIKGFNTIKRQENYINGPDRTSNLPEPILHRILSVLSTKDATKTSVLSKTWNSAWNSFPILIFNQREFFPNSLITSSRSRNGSKKRSVLKEDARAKNFCKYVRNTIARRQRESPQTSIQKFELHIDFPVPEFDDHSRDVNSWLEYAVNNNVQDLALHNYTTFHRTRFMIRYFLPQCLYRAKSLRKLNLFACCFPDEYSITNNGIGSSLKILKLSSVFAPEKMLQSLVSNCQVLEELFIQSCGGFEFLKIENSPGLKRVELYLDIFQPPQIVSIEAPNLECLSYGGCSENVLRSIKACNSKENVKELSLYHVKLTDELVQVIKEFPMLEMPERISSCRGRLDFLRITVYLWVFLFKGKLITSQVVQERSL